MTKIKVVQATVFMSWFAAIAIGFGLVADRAQGVSRSDAAIALPLVFVVMAVFGQAVCGALADQERRIAMLTKELARLGYGDLTAE
jgi:hypothetical protein